MDEYQKKVSKLLFSFFSLWKEKSFALGLNFASERRYSMPEGVDYSVLNTDQPIEYIKRREYYLIFHLGFWQISIGLTI